MSFEAGRYRGKLYRALSPVYVREPLSGRGAALYGGRFNPKGTLYVATSLHTAIREANQVGDLQPSTVVAYDADIDAVFDARDTAELARFGMTAEALADPSWRDQMKGGARARTQVFAETLRAQHYNGLLVRSFARGPTEQDINLVLWTWGDDLPAWIMLIDDQGRLSS